MAKKKRISIRKPTAPPTKRFNTAKNKSDVVGRKDKYREDDMDIEFCSHCGGILDSYVEKLFKTHFECSGLDSEE